MTLERHNYNRLLQYLRQAFQDEMHSWSFTTDEEGKNPVFTITWQTPKGKGRQLAVYLAEERAYLWKEETGQEVLDYLGNADDRLAELLKGALPADMRR